MFVEEGNVSNKFKNPQDTHSASDILNGCVKDELSSPPVLPMSHYCCFLCFLEGDVNLCFPSPSLYVPLCLKVKDSVEEQDDVCLFNIQITEMNCCF